MCSAQVEKNRARFSSIDDRELASRVAFIATVRASVKRCRDVLSSGDTKAKVERMNDGVPSYSRNVRDEPRQLQHQQMHEQEQEATLDDMLTSLQRLGVVGETISVELHEQSGLLGSLDDDLDEAGDRMDLAMRKLEKILGTKSRFGAMCCRVF